jgi:GNAT superfamily N-acetyltransferase
LTRPRVRAASATDAEDVASLLGELGFPAAAERVRGRIERIVARADAGVLLAEVNDSPAGVIAYQLVDVLERDSPQCRLTTLVTAPGLRRRGAARALVEEVERRARELGCFRLEVATRPDRGEAERFYAALGFHERPRRLVKPLD